MKVRGHTRVWGRSNPSWISEYSHDPQALHALLQDHIRRVAGQFRGKVFAWDVVNEAFDEKGRLRPTIWYDQPRIGFAGQSAKYIEQAFQWAHEVDPDALLFYDHAEGETVNAKSEAIYAMVRDFRSRTVPIDGVGLQMHVFDLNPDLTGISANIARMGIHRQILMDPFHHARREGGGPDLRSRLRPEGCLRELEIGPAGVPKKPQPASAK